MGDISERMLLLVKKHANGKPTVFAKLVGIPPSTFQYYVNGRMPHGDHLIRICEILRVNLNWLLAGKGDPYLPANAKEDVNRERERNSTEFSPDANKISDAEIIQQFEDKSYAKDLNLSLLELEQLNSEAFKEIGPYIKGMMAGLRKNEPGCKKYQGPERRIAERRVKTSSKKFKGEKDRRSGKDRRVAAQG